MSIPAIDFEGLEVVAVIRHDSERTRVIRRYQHCVEVTNNSSDVVNDLIFYVANEYFYCTEEEHNGLATEFKQYLDLKNLIGE